MRSYLNFNWARLTPAGPSLFSFTLSDTFCFCFCNNVYSTLLIIIVYMEVVWGSEPGKHEGITGNYNTYDLIYVISK